MLPPRSLTLAGLVLLLLGACAAKPPVAAQPDAQRIREIVGHLASEELAGRRCGEAGAALARDFLETQFPLSGLVPLAGREGYGHPFDIEGESLDGLEAELTGPAGRSLDLWLSVRSPLDRELGSRLRFWPEAEPAPVCAEREILIRRGPSGAGGFFSPSALQAEAAAAGASALILIPHPDDERGLYARYASRVPGRDPRLYRLPGDAPERVLAYVEAGQEAALFDEGSLIEEGWTINLPASEPLRLSGVNLLARLPGHEEPGASVILLVAHYDHLGRAEAGYYPGADDNASSVAVLLETARLLAGSELPYELRFLFTDGEELGLLGAEAYRRAFGAPARVLNLDSVGRAAVDSYRKLRDPAAASENLLILWRSTAEDPAAERLVAASRAAGFEPQDGQGPMYARGGDHHVFAAAGVPSIFLFGGFHSDYNTTDDSADRISTDRIARLARMLADHLSAERVPD